MFINTFSQPWNATQAKLGILPQNVFSNPFPERIVQPKGRDQAWIDVEGAVLGAHIVNNPAPYVQQWNLDFQLNFPGNTRVGGAYAGSKGTHLPMHSQDVD